MMYRLILRRYRNIQHPDFWNRVKPSRIANKPQWMAFDDSWVDEVSRGLRACRCFCWYPLYWPALRQMGSNMVSQAATMDLGGLPNDVLVNLNPLFCILLGPLYAHVICPILSRLGICFSPTRRIAAGFFCAAAGMAVAATIQHFIYRTSACGGYASGCKSDIANTKLTVWLQIPVYVLLANSEVLAVVAGLEHAYSQAPTNMRGLVMAVFYFTGTGGSAVAQALLPLSEDPSLVWNYVAAGALSFVAAVGFSWFNRAGEREEKEERTVVNDAHQNEGVTV
jgi:POT family proton-dependent oligopeptide transporter